MGKKNLLDNVDSIPQLVQLLQPYFLPASLGVPPLAQSPSTGGRITLLNSHTHVTDLAGVKVNRDGLIDGQTLTYDGSSGTFINRASTASVTAGDASIVIGGTGSNPTVALASTIPGVRTFSSPPIMSGASIAAATIPNGALVTTPVTSVTGSANINSTGGTTPVLSITGVIPQANGGTGAASLAAANIALTNANNNFSASQSVTGGLNATTDISTSGGALATGANGAKIAGVGGDLYIAPSSTTISGTLHWRGNGYSNADTATLSPGGNLALAGSLSVSGQTTMITSGAGAPATTTPSGSIYIRTDGGVGTRIYVSQGGGSWLAVAGV